MDGFTYDKIMEQEASIADNVNKVMGYVPFKRPINFI
jgi:hypothetical protein